MAKLYIHTWAHVHAHTDDPRPHAAPSLPVSASELAIKNKDKYLIL